MNHNQEFLLQKYYSRFIDLHNLILILELDRNDWCLKPGNLSSARIQVLCKYKASSLCRVCDIIKVENQTHTVLPEDYF